MGNGQRPPAYLANEAHEIQEGGALPSSDIADHSADPLGGPHTGKQVGGDDIVHIGEVAGLATISKDRRRGAILGGLHEYRDNRRVGRGGALARTKHIEVPEGGPLEDTGASESKHKLLARKFVPCVRGHRLGLHAFHLWQHLRVTID